MRRLVLLAAMASLIVVAYAIRAAEHPMEHPREQPTTAKAVNVQDVGKAIEAYIAKDAKLKGGYFLLYDAKDKKALVLTLDRVHQDKLARTAEKTFFACADFKEMGSDVAYDLDFWVEQTAAGLEVSEISVHKKAGAPRYQWMDHGGTWMKHEMPAK